MNNRMNRNSTFQALRQKAEQLLTIKQMDPPDFNELDLMRLVHEIEVQHVELELQNQELRQALQDLETSRNKFFELYQTAPVAFVTVNEKGFIEQVNKATGLLFRGDLFLVGRPFASLILPEDQQAYFSFLENYALRKPVSYCELRLRGIDDPIVHVHLEARTIYDDEGKHQQLRFGLIDITRLKQVQEDLRKARDELEERVTRRTAELDQRNEQLARLTIEMTLAEDRERRRLAALLHDHLQQFLAGARLNLQIAIEESGSPQDSALNDAYDLLSKALETSRTLCVELSPPVLHMHGLAEAFAWLARWMEKTHKLRVDFKCRSKVEPAQEELKVLLYQSVRELLFNVVKHAGTNIAHVEMLQQGQHIVVWVSDEGTGFDPAEEPSENARSMDSGFGLFNIRERLLLLGGACDIKSRPGDGTTVRISVPRQTDTFKLPAQKADPADAVQPTHRPFDPENIDSSNRPIRVMLVDDNAVMRKGLSSLLSRNEDIDVVAEAADGAQAVDIAQRINPDIILMDISMPVMNGIEATRRIIAQQPHVRIIGLSMYEAEDNAANMQTAGAVAYLSKTDSADQIVSAIREHYGPPDQR